MHTNPQEQRVWRIAVSEFRGTTINETVGQEFADSYKRCILA